MKTGIVILVILLILALVLGSFYVSRRNQMAIKREAMNAAWSQVDVVLQRRADLIPNLVETVKGYAMQEQAVYGEIARARSALLNASTPAEKIAANANADKMAANPSASATHSMAMMIMPRMAELRLWAISLGRCAMWIVTTR